MGRACRCPTAVVLHGKEAAMRRGNMAATTFMLCRALLAMALLASLPGQSGVRAHVTPSEVRTSTTLAGAARALTEQDMAELVR